MELPMTDAPQLAPIVSIWTFVPLMPSWLSTFIMIWLASVETVLVVLTMKPGLPLASVEVWMDEICDSMPSESAADEKASLTWSCVMSPVLVIWMDVPPENSVPKVSAEPVVTRLTTRPMAASAIRIPERMNPYFQSPTKLNCLCGRKDFMVTSPPLHGTRLR